MADPANPNVDRVAGIPFEKDAVSPMPQYTPRQRPPASGVAGTKGPDAAAPASRPDSEEYPGPQTSSTGERSEPGRQPTDGDASGKAED